MMCVMMKMFVMMVNKVVCDDEYVCDKPLASSPSLPDRAIGCERQQSKNQNESMGDGKGSKCKSTKKKKSDLPIATREQRAAAQKHLRLFPLSSLQMMMERKKKRAKNNLLLLLLSSKFNYLALPLDSKQKNAMQKNYYSIKIKPYLPIAGGFGEPNEHFYFVGDRPVLLSSISGTHNYFGRTIRQKELRELQVIQIFGVKFIPRTLHPRMKFVDRSTTLTPDEKKKEEKKKLHFCFLLLLKANSLFTE